MEQFFNDLGINPPFLIIGLLGGILAFTREKNISFSRALIYIVSGALLSNYLTPIALFYLGISSLDGKRAVHFVIGFLATHFLDGIIKITEKFASNPQGTIKELNDFRKGIKNDDNSKSSN